MSDERAKQIGADLEQRQVELAKRYYEARVEYLASTLSYETVALGMEEAMIALKRAEFERERAYRAMVIIKTELETMMPLTGMPPLDVMMGALESAEAAEAGQ